MVAANVYADSSTLVDLSFEELATLEITSVSRRAERLSEAAASIYVITADAIRRSGASTLPQVLRLAPNLQVAQVDASQYAISARGFNNAIGNKLLVLVDGRTVYTPFFSGVFWDQQELVLEDIARIEVISGPGATLWGANAVNGVINVITHSAQDTAGLLVAAGGGPRENQQLVRFGSTLPMDGHFRIYAKRAQRQNTQGETGAAIIDDWEHRQIGFRADWSQGQHGLTLQGDAYEGQGDGTRRALGLPFPPIEVSGYNLLARWSRRGEQGSLLRVQAYFDHSRRDDAVLYRPEVDIADLELQHSLQLNTAALGTHKVVWGGGHRRAKDNIQPGLFFGFHPDQRTMQWSNVFVQDEIALGPRLDLTLGAKLERNDYTGTESLPSLRLAWQQSPQQLLWAAVSRAVRAPARLDRDISLPPRPPYIIAGGPDFVAEVARVTELGWLAQLSTGVSLSATAFHHDWDRLRSGQRAGNALVQNMIEGSTRGLETWAVWQATPRWRLSAGATWLRESLHVKPGSTDPTGPSALGNDPRQWWQLRSAFNPLPGHEFDIAVRHVSALPNPLVPAYTTLDLRYGWTIARGLQLSLLGLNLGDGGHAEYGAANGRSVIPRNLQVQLRWDL